MYYYIEISLVSELDDAEESLPFLWSKVFFQIHLALAEWKESHGGVQNIGIAFPKYSEKSLGDTIRFISADLESLDSLPLERYLAGYMEYLAGNFKVHLVSQDKITGYAGYRRVQPDASVDRKKRRWIKRHPGETVPDLTSKGLSKKLPYIRMKSKTTGQSFNLYVEKVKMPESRTPQFTAYGLSAEAGLPEF